MTLHTCRDFLSTGNPLSLYNPYLAGYFLSIFMTTVLGYTIVGQTNWNISGSPVLLSQGNAGSFNQGTSDIYAFAPNNGYTVSANDIGRIVVMKSPGYPMLNSGLFRVTGINLSNNWLYLNYRSGDTPPAETGMTWALFENENTFYSLTNSTGNSITGTYTSQGTATCSRIVLQSPSSLAWQIRFCLDASYDSAAQGGAVTPQGYIGGGCLTMAPGYGGNSAGDFLPGGQHLHAALFFNKHSSDFQGLTVSLFPSGNGQARYYFWGDDASGDVFAAARSVVGGTDSMIQFGTPINEEQPLPPHNAQRLFVIGASATSNAGNNGIYWATNPGSGHAGCAFGLSNQPISCIYSLYNPLFGSTFGGISANNPIRNSPNGGDNQYVSATELVPVDLVAGTYDNMYTGYSGNEVFILEGRRLGTAPLVQMGRGNYGYFQVSTDSQHAWIHLNDGIYLPWQGSILP